MEQSSGGRNRQTAAKRMAAGVAVLLLLALFMTWLGPALSPALPTRTASHWVPSDGPPPSATPSTAGAPVADNDVEGVHRAEGVHIWLRELTMTRFVHGVPDEPFDAVWPDAADPEWDQTVFEDIEADDAIRGLSGAGTPFKGARGEEALALALQEGFGADGLLDMPERALVGLYTAWVHDEVMDQRRREAFYDLHVPEGLHYRDLSRPERIAILKMEDYPSRDRQHVLATAAFVSGRWPEHPIAQHAELAQIFAETTHGGGPRDLDAIARSFDRIEEPALRERAALLLTELWHPDSEILDRAFGVTPEGARNDLRLSTWGMARSVEAEDWARAAQWAQRTEPALEATCALDSPSAQTPCEFARYQLRETAARLIALGLQEPTTWQEALTAEAWRCHLDAPAPIGTSRTDASWDGTRWRFLHWDAPTTVTDCMDQVERTEIVPEESLIVRVTLETDGEPR